MDRLARCRRDSGRRRRQRSPDRAPRWRRLGSLPRASVAADKSTLRPIQYKDIVILLRSMRVKADQYADACRAANIPVFREGGQGYFQSMEVRDLRALLALLDNPQQDIPLAAVLRSPLASLANPEDCLSRIRLAYPFQNSEFSIYRPPSLPRAFSVSPGHVEALRVYIANQEQHHRTETFQDEFRRLLTKYGLEWDERYVWD